MFIEINTFSFLICGCNSKYFFSALVITYLLMWRVTTHHWDTLRLTECRLLSSRISRLTCPHLRSNWFEIIIKFIIKRSFSSLLRLSTHSWSVHLRMHLFIEIFSSFLQLCPIIISLFQMFHSILKLSLFSDKLLNFSHRIFASIIFKNSKSFS